jgi:hypothetical protein
MYETIIGGTVDTVLNNKDQLISYGGVSSEDIDNAGIATQSLRSLLRAYRSLTTNSARFEWYKTNHSLLLSSFIMLYSSLYSLMQNRAVYVEMTKREKTTRFYQFISQMYVICMNLDDSASLSKDWYIYDIQSKKNITLMQILEPDLYFEDTNNATPTNVSWPSEVEKVEIPTTTVVPEKPATMFEPYPPTVVSEPIPPEVVVQPVAPGVVLAPGAKPTQPALSTTQRSLLTELENGNIKNRLSVTSKYDYKIETSINTFLTAADIYPFPVVTFVNYNGTVIVDLVLKDASEASKIRPDIPPSSYEMYTFEYWETTGGNRVDFNNVIRNLTIYPHFSTSVAQYTVTWVMKDKTITTKCAYGVVPECPESVNDYYDSEYKYTFECWDKDISPALGDTSYTAQYSKEKRIYEIEWIIDKSVYVSDCEFGVIPECPESDLDYYTLDGYYEFKGWDKPVSKVTENTKYTAVFERHDLVSEQNNNDYEIVGDSSSFIITAKNAANMFNITYLSILAAKNDMKISVVANDKCVVDIPSSVLKTNVNNGVSLKVEFNQISEESFTMLVEMVDGSGNTIDTNGLMVKIKETDVSNYKCYAVINGSREELSFFKQGEYLVLTLKDSQSDLIFEKKDDNQEDEYFTVNFYVDNNLYSSKKYKFGDKLEMPETPTKEETQEYTFSFTGWEPTVVSVVTKNVDYHGSFKQTKKAGSDDYNVSPHTTYFPVHLIIIAIVVIAGITVGTIFLVKLLKSKKRQKMD